MQKNLRFCDGLTLEMVEFVLGLIEELDVRFPKQSVLNAVGVVYPQYWLQSNVKNTFLQHLEVLKAFYCTPCPCGVVVDGKLAPMVHAILLAWDLDVQQGFFKLTMKSSTTQAIVEVVALISDKAHPMVVNPPTHLWLVINASQLLFHTFPKYLELAKIAMIHILGFVEDERCFSSVSFLKDKVHHHLNPHCN
jgi:hypothetical protein